MAKKYYNFYDILYHDVSNFDYGISATIDGVNVILCSASDFKANIHTHFTDFMIINPVFYSEWDDQEIVTFQTLTEACNYVHAVFTRWKKDRLPAFIKLYQALNADYDPISNYDKTSKITTDYKGKEKTTTTPTGEEKDTFVKGAETNTTTDSATTYDSSNEYETGQSVQGTLQYTDTNTTSFTNRKTEEEKEYTSRQDEVNEHTTGNIGVTTSQQMIESQISLTDNTANNIPYYIVRDFVLHHLILV